MTPGRGPEANEEPRDPGEPGGSHGHLHGHAHSHGEAPPIREDIARWLWVAVAVCGAVTVLAVAVLWPGDSEGSDDPLVLDASDVVAADVTASDPVECSFDPAAACRLIVFTVTDGPTAGNTASIELTADTSVSVGDGIRVASFENEVGEVIYSFYEFERESSMLWLLALFVAAVLLLGRWRGLGALAGLAFSLTVIVVFTLPSILDGSNAVWVALTTASLIAFAALFLAHGLEIGTAVALLSTFASLALTAILALVFVGATNLTGLADGSSTLLGGLASGIDARGILLAGIVIGALGVLDDVTVTQVSAVWELKRLSPSLSTSELVAPALRIGRDHISSTVNTLFLAYAGAALPLLLLLTEAGQSIGDAVTREIVATEVVRALVGSIGLVVSVPISTWLAAFVVSGSSSARPHGPTAAS